MYLECLVDIQVPLSLHVMTSIVVVYSTYRSEDNLIFLSIRAHTEIFVWTQVVNDTAATITLYRRILWIYGFVQMR